VAAFAADSPAGPVGGLMMTAGAGGVLGKSGVQVNQAVIVARRGVGRIHVADGAGVGRGRIELGSVSGTEMGRVCVGGNQPVGRGGKRPVAGAAGAGGGVGPGRCSRTVAGSGAGLGGCAIGQGPLHLDAAVAVQDGIDNR